MTAFRTLVEQKAHVLSLRRTVIIESEPLVDSIASPINAMATDGGACKASTDLSVIVSKACQKGSHQFINSCVEKLITCILE